MGCFPLVRHLNKIFWEMITLKTQKKLAVVFVFAMAMFAGFQTICEAGTFPGVAALKDYTPIPIPVHITRGDEKFDLSPQPGFDVTLLMNQTVHFAWSNNSPNSSEKKNFIIKNEKGNKIFEQSIGDKSSMDIVPGKINLKTGQKYFWSVDNDLNIFAFTILDEQTEKELLGNLAEIDAENLSPEECVIKKAGYLQMLSEEYPENFDLYWLIAQWLSEMSPTDEKFVEKKSELLHRCAQHLDDEM